MRLIDADALYEEHTRLAYKGKYAFHIAARAWLEQAPTVDAVPVVRCSECKHKGWIQEPCHGKSIDYCRQLERPVEKQFFCGLGERKGGVSAV